MAVAAWKRIRVARVTGVSYYAERTASVARTLRGGGRIPSAEAMVGMSLAMEASDQSNFTISAG